MILISTKYDSRSIKMNNWKNIREKLKITPEEESIIEIEKNLLRTKFDSPEEKEKADLTKDYNVE